MDNRQIGLAVGIAALCAVAWIFGGGNEDAGQLGDIGAMGLIALVVIAAISLLRRRKD